MELIKEEFLKKEEILKTLKDYRINLADTLKNWEIEGKITDSVKDIIEYRKRASFEIEKRILRLSIYKD